MKLKHLIALSGLVLPLVAAQAGPPVPIFVGGNSGCNPGFVRPTFIIGRPAVPVVCRLAPLGPTLPIVYQPRGPLYPSPIYYSIGPTTITYRSDSAVVNSPASTYSPVVPLVIPPPVMLNRPVVVHESATFSWKR